MTTTPTPDVTPERLRQLRAELDGLHAVIWRAISMSPDWLRLTQVEAKIQLVDELLGETPAEAPAA